jgi:hypothetical protein
MGGLFVTTESVKNKLKELGCEIIGQSSKFPFKFLIPHGQNASAVKKSLSRFGIGIKKSKGRYDAGETNIIYRKNFIIFFLIIILFVFLMFLPLIIKNIF